MIVVLLIVTAGWMVLGALITIGTVGKQREPITGGVAAFSVAITAAMVAVMVTAAVSLSASS